MCSLEKGFEHFASSVIAELARVVAAWSACFDYPNFIVTLTSQFQSKERQKSNISGDFLFTNGWSIETTSRQEQKINGQILETACC